MATRMTGVRKDVRADRFHFRMAIVFVAIAFGGFFPTYWAKVSTGTFGGPAFLHIHGLLLFSWTLFYLSQSWLVASGRTPDHRVWGMAGISLFSVMMCSIVVAKIIVLKQDAMRGYGEAGLRFSAVTFVAMPVMIGLFAAAIANVQRPDIHKRLMFVLMTGCMIPALARVFLTLFAPNGGAGPPPPAIVALPPSIVADLLLVVAMIHDRRTIGRVHPAYIYGGLLLLLEELLVAPVAASDLWVTIASSFVRLAG